MPVDRDMAAAKSAGGKKSDNKVHMGTQGVSGPYRAVISDVWLRYTDDDGHFRDGRKVPYTNKHGANPGTMQKCKLVFELEGRSEILDFDMAVLFGEKSNYTKVAGWFGYDVNAFDPELTKGMYVDIFVDCQPKIIAEGAGKGTTYWWSKIVGCKPVDGAAPRAASTPVDTRQSTEEQADRLGDMSTAAAEARKKEKLALITRIMRVLDITSKEQLDGRLRDLCDDVAHVNNLPGAHNTLGAYTKEQLLAYVEPLERGRAEAQARQEQAAATKPAAAAPQRAERPTGGISAIQLSVITTMTNDLVTAGKMTVADVEQLLADTVAAPNGTLREATPGEAKIIINTLKSIAAA